MSETLRRQSNRDKALEALQARHRLSNVELAQIAGLRFGGRLEELRKQGHRITTEPKQGGLVFYRYVGPPQPPFQLEML